MPLYNLEDINTREIIPGYQARFLHSASMTMAFWEIQSGAEMPEHAHPHEQVSKVLEGEFELTIEGNTHRLRPGLVTVIPSNAAHSGIAITNCRILDVFHPVREDYRSPD